MGDKPKEEAESPFKSLGTMIPSVYYDIIARVIPGAALLASLTPVRCTIISSSENVWLQSLVWLGAGYIAGLVLTPVSALVLWPISSLMKHCAWVAKKFEVPTGTTPPRCANDFVGLKNPDLGTTLGKMQAESTCCGSLVMAFMLLLVFHDESIVGALLHHNWGAALTLLTLAALFIAALWRQSVYLGRQMILYRELVDPTWAPKPPIKSTS